ncbi:hypothetical protein [Botrimarina mediterranea]|uniref:hypothetical protein n=1 Tax=Botrimarina mediterranea TaxID=2528022 RepID=UPI0011A333D0|nr:hypothetical protein [Botrimarina mediterranea]
MATSQDQEPVRIFARSTGPAYNDCYLGGTVYHDFGGMTLARKANHVIEWIHSESIGYFDSHKIADGVGLWLYGMLVFSGGKDNLARQVATQLSKGVPLEASIVTDSKPLIDEIQRGRLASVNGLRVAGPCAIVRKWTLRGVAICPYGADAATRSELVGDSAQSR